MTRVKICCIQSLEEAALAARADLLGLVGPMPSGPGPIPPARIAEIAAAYPNTILLSSETQAAPLIAQVRAAGTNAVQLVDRTAPRDIAALRAAVPGLHVIQVIHVNGPSAVEAAADIWPHADALLLDSGSPNKAVKELGGTGRVHDWRISAEIVRQSPVPTWLAGGLSPDNVAEAIRIARPYGVDICSGLRAGGRLDADLLARFFAELGHV